jgi:hypothetical protein
MLRSMAKNHSFPPIPKRAIMAWKFMARSAFTDIGLECPQCGSDTFFLEGYATTALRKVCVDGEFTTALDGVLTMEDFGRFIPTELHCRQCSTVTHFR